MFQQPVLLQLSLPINAISLNLFFLSFLVSILKNQMFLLQLAATLKQPFSLAKNQTHTFGDFFIDG